MGRLLIVLLLPIAMTGCKSTSDAELDYLRARINALDSDYEQLREELNDHLCEFHADDYDCVTLQSIIDEVESSLEEGPYYWFGESRYVDPDPDTP